MEKELCSMLGETMKCPRYYDETTWETADEKNYIKKIGENKPGTPEHKATIQRKIGLLQGYLRACLKRVHWENLHKKEIMDFAIDELKRMEAL